MTFFYQLQQHPGEARPLEATDLEISLVEIASGWMVGTSSCPKSKTSKGERGTMGPTKQETENHLHKQCRLVGFEGSNPPRLYIHVDSEG